MIQDAIMENCDNENGSSFTAGLPPSPVVEYDSDKLYQNVAHQLFGTPVRKQYIRQHPSYSYKGPFIKLTPHWQQHFDSQKTEKLKKIVITEENQEKFRKSRVEKRKTAERCLICYSRINQRNKPILNIERKKKTAELLEFFKIIASRLNNVDAPENKVAFYKALEQLPADSGAPHLCHVCDSVREQYLSKHRAMQHLQQQVDVLQQKIIAAIKLSTALSERELNLKIETNNTTDCNSESESFKLQKESVNPVRKYLTSGIKFVLPTSSPLKQEDLNIYSSESLDTAWNSVDVKIEQDYSPAGDFMEIKDKDDAHCPSSPPPDDQDDDDLWEQSSTLEESHSEDELHSTTTTSSRPSRRQPVNPGSHDKYSTACNFWRTWKGTIYFRSVALKKNSDGEHICPFDCQYSVKKFGYHLRMHVAKCHVEQIPEAHKCDHEKCDQKFVYWKHLVHHKRKDHEGGYKCSLCGNTLATLSSLQAHIKFTHHGLKPHSCEQCGRCFSTKHSLKGHVKTHTKSFACTACPEMFTKQFDLTLHFRNVHTPVVKKEKRKPGHGDHVCDVCGARFSFLDSLSTHKKVKHLGISRHTCDHCGKAFPGKSALVSHLRKHTGERPFSCKQCSASFGHQISLKSHVQKKHPDPGQDQSAQLERYKCDDCGKTFSKKNILEVHRRQHTGERPFVCTVCNKDFIQKKSLTSHIQIRHEGINPYVCERCGKGFSTRKGMIIHIRRHDGEKPYVCRLCPDKMFVREYELNLHTRRKHPDYRQEQHEASKKSEQVPHFVANNDFSSESTSQLEDKGSLAQATKDSS